MTAASACDCLRTDHRQMETYIDRLLTALRRAGRESVPDVQAAVRDIRRLSSIHFEKEEVIFYPSLRPAFPDLLAQMDRQHAEIREVEQYIGELLSDPLPFPRISLAGRTSLVRHTAPRFYSDTSLKKKISCSASLRAGLPLK